jgi:hypothetical protein
MMSARKSLREAVESWLPPNRAIPFRVRSLRRNECKRCVRVEAKVPTGDVAICFFQHDDGGWHVFPPDPHRLMMRVAWPGI